MVWRLLAAIGFGNYYWNGLLSWTRVISDLPFVLVLLVAWVVAVGFTLERLRQSRVINTSKKNLRFDNNHVFSLIMDAHAHKNTAASFFFWVTASQQT
jgi:hypothetical protein